MSTMSQSLVNSLEQLSSRYVDAYLEQQGHLPVCEIDSDWPSICIQGEHNEELQYWKPMPLVKSLSFKNVEDALELELHPDIKTYFTTFFSEQFVVECSEGKLSLLFAWNNDDFERLQENFIGHVLMKQKLKQDITLFFAVTDDDDYMLSVNNKTGEIWVERVGCEPHKKVASSLSEFIESLLPVIE